VSAAPTTILMLSVDEAPRLRDSLPAAAAQPGAEVLVVDNACRDETGELARAHGARHLRLPERVSYCAAVNAGLAACDGEAVLLLNADCVLDAGFLAAALPRLRDPRVGSVAPKLLRARDTGRAGRLEALDAAGMVVDRRRKNGLVGHNAPPDAYSTPAEAFGGDGAAVLYRRATLSQCALGAEVLDEDMQLWAADADLAWRARALGWRCAYEPGALAWHVRFYSPSTRAGVAPEHRRLQFRNRYLMMIKNDSARALLRDLPAVLAYEVLALGHALLRERSLLGAYADAVRLAPAAWRRRRALGARGARAPVPFGLRPPA
jgi:GT2 family glycosyltransferase